MSTIAPLRVPPFGRLLASYTVNELGDVLGAIALAILVYDETQDPLAVAALFMAAKFVPAVIAPVLTARIDGLSMRPALTALYVVEAVAFGGLALLAGAESFLLAAILALALVDGTIALTARALTRGVVAQTLPSPELLRAGNGLINVAFAAATVGGAAAAGAIVAGSSVQLALAIDAGSFALVALLIGTCRDLPGPRRHGGGFGLRLREGFTFVRASPLLRLLLAGQALALVLFTLAVPVEVVYAKDTLDAGDLGFGLLAASWGGGIVVGSGVFILVRGRDPLAVVLSSTAAVGLGYGGMALVRDLGPACAFSVLGGLGNGVQWVSVMTLLQERTPPELQARVVGLLESLGAAMPGIGFVLGGVTAAALSAPATYGIAGACLLVLVAAGTVALTVGRAKERDTSLPSARL